MSKNIKGITIEIGGNTTPLSKALEDVNSKSKNLQGELRNVDRLLKLDPTNVELLAQKQDLLAKAAENTKEKLKILKEAEEELNQKFEDGKISVEDYEKQQAGLRREVIQAEQTLKSQESQLKELEKATNTAAKATEEFAMKSEDLSKKLAPLSAAGAGVVAGMTAIAVSAANSADDINTLSKVTGISTDELQKFAYATDLVDVSQEVLSGSLRKLTANMKDAKDGSSSAISKFKELGITYADSITGELRDGQEVFYEAIQALGQIENATERDAVAMELFGKSAQDLNPIIMDGGEQLRLLGEKAAEAGLILGKDALDNANKFNDVMDETKANISATKDVVGAAIAEAFLPLAESIAETITDITACLRNLSPQTLTIIGIIASVVAILAPLIALIGKVAFGINQIIILMPAIMTAFTSLGGVFAAIMSPLGLLITAITLIATTLIYLWNTNEEFKTNTINLWNSLLSFFVTTLTNISQFFVTVFEGIGTFFSAWGKLLKGDFNGFLEDMKSLVTDFVPNMISAGKELFNGMWDGMKEIWTQLKTWVSDTVSWLADKLAFWRKSSDEMNSGEPKADGSHAQGLGYVPFDGYRAILHEGERVLTKSENRDYNTPQKAKGDTTINQHFYNVQKSPAEQQRIAKREFKRLAV